MLPPDGYRLVLGLPNRRSVCSIWPGCGPEDMLAAKRVAYYLAPTGSGAVMLGAQEAAPMSRDERLKLFHSVRALETPRECDEVQQWILDQIEFARFCAAKWYGPKLIARH